MVSAAGTVDTLVVGLGLGYYRERECRNQKHWLAVERAGVYRVIQQLSLVT